MKMTAQNEAAVAHMLELEQQDVNDVWQQEQLGPQGRPGCAQNRWPTDSHVVAADVLDLGLQDFDRVEDFIRMTHVNIYEWSKRLNECAAAALVQVANV